MEDRRPRGIRSAAGANLGDDREPLAAPDDGGRGPTDGRPLGRVGFESGSDVYERARPSYTDEVVAYLIERLGLGPSSTVLDLAAGTGKMTRLVVPVSPRCVAIEPSPSMRTVFVDSVPAGNLVAGTAEAIPVADQRFDAVVVAQAFHWFDTADAVSEIARTLRPGGGLALVWNERDESDPLVAELVRVSKWDVFQPYPIGNDFSGTLDATGLFGPVVRRKFRFAQFLDRTTFVEQVASRSYVQVLAPRARAQLLARVGELVAARPEPVRIPYLTDVFVAHRRGPGDPTASVV